MGVEQIMFQAHIIFSAMLSKSKCVPGVTSGNRFPCVFKLRRKHFFLHSGRDSNEMKCSGNGRRLAATVNIPAEWINIIANSLL